MFGWFKKFFRRADDDKQIDIESAMELIDSHLQKTEPNYSERKTRERKQIDQVRRNREAIRERIIDLNEAAWNEAKVGGNWKDCLREKNHLSLIDIRLMGSINQVRIIACGPGGIACPAGRELQNEAPRPLDDEIAGQRLPAANCTCYAFDPNMPGFCLCWYEPAFDDE